MSRLVQLFLSLMILGVSTVGFAQTQTASPSAKKLQTSASFDDLLIQGKYQFSDEAVTTVEEDKVLDSLLGVRKDFRDRLERSALKR
jgi:hypothetical protein